MNIARFPCYDFSDPRSGISLRIEAERYNRIVRFDGVLQRAYLEPKDGPTWYAEPAKVIRFPTERTKSKGEL